MDGRTRRAGRTAPEGVTGPQNAQNGPHFAAAVDRQDVAKALAADDAFHHVIIEAAGNPVIARVVEQLHPQLHRVLYRILYRKFSALLGGEETSNHHEELILVCEQRDAQAAAAMSGEHWSHLGDLISGLFDSENFPASKGWRSQHIPGPGRLA